MRMAIGARRTDILRLMIGEGIALALIGIAVGLGAAIALGRFISSLLYEVSPADPLTLASIALLFFVIALCPPVVRRNLIRARHCDTSRPSPVAALGGPASTSPSAGLMGDQEPDCTLRNKVLDSM